MNTQNTRTHRDPDTILFDSDLDKIRVAVLDKQRKTLHLDEQSEESKWLTGQIYSARITSIKPQIAAVFVEFNSHANKDQKQKHGFLAADNIAPENYLKPWSEENGDPDLNQLLNVGQKLLVQVKKDQQGHESKGAALTTYISLAGSYLVLLPNSNKYAVSRKADAAQKQKAREIIELLNIPEEHGIIVRTAGIDKPIEELNRDYQSLLNQWKRIKEFWSKAPVPTLLHEEENVIVRTLRDRLNQNTSKVVINNQKTYDFVHEHLTVTRPDLNLEQLLELYDHPQPLFEHYDIEEQIEELFKTTHHLPSGGHILIQGTEAGVMIDVNSSRSTVGNNIEETALNTNLEAAQKAADLLRLRDMGGIIYIDFIDMKQIENRTQVEQTFLNAALCDKAKIKHEPISELSGCMVVLRQSMGYPFFKSALEPIAYDPSIVVGKKRSVASYATHVMHLILKNAQYGTDILQLQLPVDVATYLLNENRSKLTQIEERYHTQIVVIPNQSFKEQKCVLKRFKLDDESTPSSASYQEVQHTQNEKPWRSISKNQVVKSMQSQSQRNAQSSSHEDKPSSMLDSIWEAIFGKANNAQPESENTGPTNQKTYKNRSSRRNINQQKDRRGDQNIKHPRRRANRQQGQDTHSSQSTRATAPDTQTLHPQQPNLQTTQPQINVDPMQQQPESSVIPSMENEARPMQHKTRTRKPRRQHRKPFINSHDNNFHGDSDLIKHLDDD